MDRSKRTKPFVITISRMLSSGGAYIGQQLANRLDILYCDRVILEKAAQEFYLPAAALENLEEKPTSFWKLFLQSGFTESPGTYLAPDVYQPTDRELFAMEARIIGQLASKQSAVIIGRGSFYILRDNPRHLSIFLHSNQDFRKKRIQALYDLSEEEAIKMIKDCDSERSQFHHTFADNDWTDARQYQMCLDTGKTGLDECVEIILRYVEDKFL